MKSRSVNTQLLKARKNLTVASAQQKLFNKLSIQKSSYCHRMECFKNLHLNCNNSQFRQAHNWTLILLVILNLWFCRNHKVQTSSIKEAIFNCQTREAKVFKHI